ncbi:centromere/kinetochore protein zw10 homolog [Lepeophtheirus salmonis]|uniref:centromere/kinetochore protein zw10 homolog n=1 Tax=Lepeophtheirus salmonis TaxID=72036 RepID=UPI001AE49D5B|nr:centromere/kinetochore protein zw10 homolog [Lepeophtheirus salmonis]
MSSFVRAVLSASGALKPKEDLSATIARLENKGEELKSLLRVEVESRYESLGSTKGIEEAIDKLSDVKAEMERIWSGIDVEGVESGSQEMKDLLHKLESLSGTILLANEMKEAWTLMERIDEYLAQEKPLEASQTFSQLGNLLKSIECVDEDHMKALSSIRQEYITSLDILNHSLSASWDKSVSICMEESNSILFLFSSSNLQPLISAMHNADLLTNKLKLFAKTLYNKILKSIMTKSSTIVSKSNVSLQISYHATAIPSTFEIFDKLKIIFHLLSLNPLNITPDKSFIVSIAEVIKEDFIKSIINDLLSNSVPDSNLGDFKDNMGNVVDGFESFLKTIGFLEESNNELTNYINDIETVFVNKKLSSYLFEARTTIKQPLYETIRVSNDVIKEEQALLKLKSKVHTFPINEEDLPLPDKDIFKSSQFSFPNCLISKSVLELKNIIYRILDEAVESSSSDNGFLCNRLVQGSRYIFELYLNMISIVHEDDFNKLPQVSVVAHNDCFYLAHHCMLLGIHYRDFIPLDTEKGQYLTYIDFLPYLREMGEKILKRQIENQRNSLLEHVKGMDINSKSPEIVLRRISHGLHHLKKVWYSVLPDNVYPRIIGTLINAVLEEIIINVIDLENIVADSALQTYNAFSEFAESLPQMFIENSQPMRYVRYWLRFKELVFILNANLREIEHRWAEGKGPLASEFSVDEIKRLIRAIFQNTERRATVLSRIKYES